VVPTPLSRLSFWRLVLDEAQLAGGTSKAAEMAQHIRAQYRWAITGVHSFWVSSRAMSVDCTGTCQHDAGCWLLAAGASLLSRQRVTILGRADEDSFSPGA
jgi:hypothetical protein